MTLRQLRVCLASSTFLISAAVAATTWYHTNDANSYLDMARFVSQRNWDAAINPFWGLSYGWALGAFFALIGPSPLQEIAAIRVLNVLMLLLATAAFDLLLASLLKFLADRSFSRGRPVLSEPAMCTIAYALFLWSCFCLNWPSRISPDMLVSAIFFAAVGLLLRVLGGEHLLRDSILFACTLTLAYYTKAIFVPLGLIFLACYTVLLVRARRSWPALPIALAVLAVGCAPYYLAVARHTRGVPRAASLNYAWHVNRLWHFVHWQGDGVDVGKPIHATQQITRGLRAYAFAEPIETTYPPWYDPSYWYAGFHTHFQPVRQATALGRNLRYFLHELLRRPVIWVIAIGVALLFFWSGNRLAGWRIILELWPLLVPSLAGCCLYLAVHVEMRYLQPMIPCIMLGLLFPWRTCNDARSLFSSKVSNRSVGLGVVAVALFSVALSLVIRTRQVVEYVSLSNPLARDREWILAQHLRGMQHFRQAHIAIIGNGVDCLWAFLANVRIVAEVPHDYDGEQHLGDADAFWTAPAAQQQEVLTAFHKAGAVMVIADPKIPVKLDASWMPVEKTGYYYQSLEQK